MCSSMGYLQSIVGFCVCYGNVVEYREMHCGDIAEYYHTYNKGILLTILDYDEIPCGNIVFLNSMGIL